ncbi:MAG TPA: acetylglutamate kinase [Pricia sp.]|nr:acetylglutamate kinase [Pricia sp.]
MKPTLSIVKIGGNVIGNAAALSKFLKLFSELEGFKILVHGGGKLATEIAQKLGVASRMVGGRRITDEGALKVITMVYSGLTNKNIVAELQAKGCNAIGMSGADGDTIQAHKRPVGDIDYGLVGDVDGVNEALLTQFLTLGLTPVFCAMTHDGKGQLLNTNADTIASELAIGLGQVFETTLYYCFEKKGVLRDVADDTSVIPHIDSVSYQGLLQGKRIADGMLPKLTNCFHALNHGVAKVCIGSTTMLSESDDLYTTITL